MKDHFARIDDALIDRLFQPVADWMSHQMALGAPRAACGSINLASAAWLLAHAGALAAAAKAHDIAAFAFGGGGVVLGLWGFAILREVFQRRGAAAKAPEQANPLRAGMLLHRSICLAWLVWLTARTFAGPFSLASLALLAMAVFTTAAVYIGACSNYPPARRKAREDGGNWALAAGRV